MSELILNLASPTPGDSDFYSRWRRLGEVTDNYHDEKIRNNATVLVVDHRVEVSDNLITRLPKLKYICSANTAHTHIKCDYKSKNIEIISLQGEVSFLSEVYAVPEFTMHLILALARPSNAVGTLLRGKRLGIVGHGRIGKRVAKIASNGFGMNIYYVDKHSTHKDWVALFSNSDFISIHVNEVPETKKIVSRQYLELMQPHTVFINTARGSVIDEECLSELLWNGRIAGAAVDVIEDTTYLNDDVPNLLITDHIAGSTLDDRIRTDEFIVSKLYSKLHKAEMN